MPRIVSRSTLSTIITVTAVAGIIAANVGYSNPESAKRILAEEGYTSVTIDGRTMFGCEREFYRTMFLAKNSRGITVRGVV